MKENKRKTSQRKDLLGNGYLQKNKIKGGHFLLGIKLSSSFPRQMDPFEKQIGKIKLLSQSDFVSLSNLCACVNLKQTQQQNTKSYVSTMNYMSMCMFL